MEQVSLRPDYFALTAFDSYVDWQTALVREFFQNSVDANSTQIRFQDGEEFSIFDNGCMMDREVLTECLLKLLGTNKGEFDVGGKGRAKEILFFAWPSWQIKTGNLLVNGSYINFKIQENDSPIDGTEVKLKLDKKADLKKAFLEYAKKCSFSQSVSWNGESVVGMGKLEELTLVDERKVLDVSNADAQDPFINIRIYNHPQKGAREVYVRSNGLFMFARPFRTDRGLIVEIPKGFSRIMLTGNRDDFLSFYKDNFEMILMAQSLVDSSGDNSQSRSLHVQQEADKTFHSNLKTWSNVLETIPQYQIPMEDLFYDHNLSGRDVLIELEETQRDEDGSYDFLIGANAGLEDGKIKFDRIYFSHQRELKEAFNLADVVLSGRAEFKRKYLGPGVIDFPWPYEGSLVVYGYQVRE